MTCKEFHRIKNTVNANEANDSLYGAVLNHMVSCPQCNAESLTAIAKLTPDAAEEQAARDRLAKYFRATATDPELPTL